VSVITADPEFETHYGKPRDEAPQDVQRHDPLPGLHVLRRAGFRPQTLRSDRQNKTPAAGRG
jgi:hypothetical protein